jgi:hypothetical protein
MSNIVDGTPSNLELNYKESIYKMSDDDGEAERQKAEAERAKNEVARISAESTRETNEAQRIANENKRIASENTRVTAETKRTEAEEARETAEATRVTQEASRVTEEAKRVAEWEEIKKSATGVKTYICASGEYDETTKVPTIAGKAGTIYLTPISNDSADQNGYYYEWLYLEDTKAFEKIGTTDVNLTPIDTDTVDAIVNGETKTGDEVVTTTGFSYIFGKIKNIFAPLVHTHKKTDITDFDHTHVRNEITDFDHTHLKADVTDFAHVHEGDALVPDSINATTSVKQNGVNVSLEGHKHFKSDIADLTIGEGTLTLKAGDKDLGTFSANATDDNTIDIGEVIVNDATLTIKQEGKTKATFSANADANVDVDIVHPTGSGWNHIPEGGVADNYLAYASDGTATWSPVSDITDGYAKLASPTFTGTPSAPTAAVGTSSTQIATTAFVSDAINTAITEVENGTY